MQRFFESVLEPVFDLENIKTIVEIGAEKGISTSKLIRYANKKGGKIYTVDPAPLFDADTWEKENPDTFVMVRDMSLNVIKDIRDADCFLIDGDHNWYTVYHELKMIYDTYGRENFPLVFFHDILWPYDRRDLYYCPENIPAVYRHEYEVKAIKPGSDELCSEGLNERHCNAKAYGGEQNGVLTAIEDFVRDYPDLELEFMSHDVLFGLGIIASRKKYPRALDYFYSADALKGTMKVCERERIDKMVEIRSLVKKLGGFTSKEKNNQIAKIYPNLGDGYNESTSMLIGEYDAESGCYYGKAVFDKPPVSLRFDPVNDSFCIVENISVTGSSGKLDILSSNGISFGGSYIFTNKDPQFIFSNTGSREFVITANFYPFRSIAALDFINNMLRSNVSLSDENTELCETNRQLSDENASLSESNRSLSNTVDELNKSVKALSSKKNVPDTSALNDTVKKYEAKLSEAAKANALLTAQAKSVSAAASADRRTAEKLFCSEGGTGWKYALKTALNSGLFAARTNVQAIRQIRKKGGFDVLSYCSKNKDVMAQGIDPLIHFMWFGGYEGRNPSADFDVKKYLEFYDDVKKSGVNPYAHYLMFGKAENRKAFPEPKKQLIPDIKSAVNIPELKISADPKAPEKVFTKADAVMKKKELTAENSRMMRGSDFSVKGQPLVSIIIINRNGIEHLRTLFASFKEKEFYRNFEIIFVDNASTDVSVKYIRSLTEYKMTIIENKQNESFSKANNQGISAAKGEYILFLNNDTEVTDHWLDCLIHTAQEHPDSGAVGARLVYPYVPDGYLNHSKSFTVQHMGIVFEESSFNSEPFIRPMNYRNGDDPMLSELGSSEPFAISGVTAACMLVRRSVLDEVGGFDEEYVYGYEDCDLDLAIFRKGYVNYVCPHALLFHYEFGTQSSNTREEIVKRRTNNICHFRDKWQGYLSDKIWQDKLEGTSLFIGGKRALTVAVVVTDDDPDTSAGDYFTGMELCTALSKAGCRTKFLALRKDNCYDVGSDTDVLISLLEKYDITKIKNASSRLITIAWARNWFDRWCSLPYIKQFSYIFASSPTACSFMKDLLDRDVELFPIATNANRFNNENTERDKNSPYFSDYVFTGSYWGAPREIIDILCPDELPYSFKIYGANWDKIPKFKNNYEGFVTYSTMPEIYRNTRIVVDDANHVTKPYGAVNSRVFDALAAGRLVVTNGVIGADETFEGLLPSFETKEEFNALIKKYLADDQAYSSKVNELREFVLKNHTYDIRANQLISFLKSRLLPDEKKIAIMMPVPRYSEAQAWGDYHFGVALKKQFEANGFTAEMRILPEWDMPFNGKYVLVLRGLSIYKPKKQHINIMWNISHPDDIPLSEYDSYDKVFVSSKKWTEHLKKQLRTDVDVLMQCTDEEVFYPSDDKDHKYQLLFVGNSRKIFRKIIKDLIPTKYDLAIFGTNWQPFVDSRYIKGENIPNSELRTAYSSCDILLNDHWDDMREKGFVSNRIFDGLAAGAFIITDEIDDMDSDLKECVAFYKDKADLAQKVEYYMENPEKRKEMSEKGMKIVREKHTFKNRAEKILEYIRQTK